MQKTAHMIQFEFECFASKMLVRLISLIILVQVLESAYGEVIIEKARVQHYMQIENGKIIRHVQGVDLQDSDLNGVPAGSGRNIQQPFVGRSQNRNAAVTEKCGPGEWRDYWGRCRELY
ncbi:hypothetical protein HA402_006344 [Bradysia odoriphaga]|nr:hypothetical protein HA402_006344 [Bradysia odoriphaga]